LGILLEITAPIFVLIIFGYLAIKFKFLNHTVTQGLMKFVQNVAMPVLLFNAVAKMDLSLGFNHGLLLSFYLGAFVSFILALFLTYKVFRRPWEESVVIGFTALFGNTVLLGLAVVDRAFGEEALASTYSIIALHAPFCFLVGITSMEAFKESGKMNGAALISVFNEMGKNAIIIGMLIGFITNLLNISLPAIAQLPVDMISGAAIPTALFGLGGILAQYKPRGDLKVIILVCTITLIVHPTLTWLLATQMFSLSYAQVQSAVLTSAMPPGLNAFIFATMYKTGRKVAASSALIGTVISIFTASLAIYWVS